MKALVQTLISAVAFSFLSNFAFAAPPMRIVSLAPNLTEIVFALGEGSHLVGDTVQCDFPPEAKKTPKIGTFASPGFELILKAEPTLVLATEGNPKVLVEQLKKKNIKVVTINPQKIADLPGSIKLIGDAVGKNLQAAALSDEIEKELALLHNSTPSARTALIVLALNPVYSVNRDTWLGDLFAQAGYKNVAADSPIRYPALAKEFLIKNPADINFVMQGAIPEQTKEPLIFLKKSLFSEKSKNVILPSDVFERAGPRIVKAMEFLRNAGVQK